MELEMKMKKRALVASVMLVSGVAYAGGGTHWGYSGHEGPEHWGELSPKFATCSSGKSQSPINLSGFIEADLKPITFDYRGLTIIGAKNYSEPLSWPESTKRMFCGLMR